MCVYILYINILKNRLFHITARSPIVVRKNNAYGTSLRALAFSDILVPISTPTVEIFPSFSCSADTLYIYIYIISYTSVGQISLPKYVYTSSARLYVYLWIIYIFSV